MKTINQLFILIIFGTLFTYGCKKEDISAPSVTLVGEPEIIVLYKSPFVDPGATALDEEEGDLTSQIVVRHDINTSVVGDYDVIYECRDSENNVGIARRTVKVRSTLENYVKSYSVAVQPIFQTGTGNCPANLPASVDLNYLSTVNDFQLGEIRPFPTQSGVLLFEMFELPITGHIIFNVPSGQKLSTGEEIECYMHFGGYISGQDTVRYFNMEFTFLDAGSQEVSACHLHLN